MSDFPLLFSPLKIGMREIKNRIVSSAHGEGFAKDGLVNERLLRYYERKAVGGTALIMTFGSGNVYEKASNPRYVSLWDPRNEPLLRELADRIHAHGALIMAQATHKGRRMNSKITGFPLQAPSAIPEEVNREIPVALGKEEIRSIVHSFAAAAERLERCGFDGIEITSYGGHLIEQFWSPVLNQRTDEYGGDLDGRMRFAVEVVDAVSKAVSDKFMIGFRMTGDPLTDNLGLNQEDMLEIAKKLDSLGKIDLFHISGSTGATLSLQAGTIPPDSFPRGCYNHLTRKMKEYLSVPVLVAGRILDPYQAEQALAKGDCDLTAMTRAIIADPDLPLKAMAGEVSRIRPCIGTNQGCIGRTFDGLPMGCAVNPAIGNDTLDNISPVEKGRCVVVVGGGPAGMETARVAAERGHKVILLERSNRLGGQVTVAAAQPERPHIGMHVSWLERELERLFVDVRLGLKATVDDIFSLDPHTVVIATGADTVVPHESVGVAIPCVTDVDVLEGKVNIEKGMRILICDEGARRGGYVANFAAMKGASRIELTTPLQTVVEDLDDTNKPSMYRSLAKNKVICSQNQILSGNREGVLILRDAWSNQERAVDDVDLIIFAGFRVAQNDLWKRLSQRNPEFAIHLIGDCLTPRTLSDAVTQGVMTGKIV